MLVSLMGRRPNTFASSEKCLCCHQSHSVSQAWMLEWAVFLLGRWYLDGRKYWQFLSRFDECLNPWPNGLASRRKLKTWVYLRLRLARACMHLRWLAMTCAHFGRDQICTQVKASFSPFGHPTQVNASWVTSINLLLANEIQDMSALKWVFCDLRVLVRKLASPFGHPTQVST